MGVLRLVIRTLSTNTPTNDLIAVYLSYNRTMSSHTLHICPIVSMKKGYVSVSDKCSEA